MDVICIAAFSSSSLEYGVSLFINKSFAIDRALILFLLIVNEAEPSCNFGCTFSQLTIDDSISFNVSLICS